MSRKLVLVLLVVSLLALSLVSCAKPLTLNILAPTDGATVDKSQVEVRANVSDAKATVWVNDATVVGKVKIRRGPGYFSTKIDLNEGIEIVDFHGSFATKQAAASV